MFRSIGQCTFLLHLLENESEIVAILATNEGKSSSFLPLSLLRGAGITVVIVPLIALRQDLLRYCDALGVPFAVWNAVTDERRVVDCPLLFVMMETAVVILFHVFLVRVILDEAHLVLMSSQYQPKIRLI